MSEIIEGTRIIALFDGWNHYPTPKQTGKGYWNFPKKGYAQWSLDAMKYHTSWDWLMPVVEKIGAMVVKFNITSNCVIFRIGSNENSDEDVVVDYKRMGKSLTEGCWLAVVAFIKWYNQQTVKQ